MFRKAIFSALVVMMASSAFAAGKDIVKKENKERNGQAGADVQVSNTGKAVEGARIIEALVNGTSASHRDAAILTQEISNNKAAYGLTGNSSVGFDRHQARIAELVREGKSHDEALDLALSERGVTKEEFRERCKPM